MSKRKLHKWHKIADGVYHCHHKERPKQKPFNYDKLGIPFIPK